MRRREPARVHAAKAAPGSKLAALALALALPTLSPALGSCILPDEVGVVNVNESNRHAVKIVEPTAITAEANDQCVATCTEGCTTCPQPPNNAPLPRFLNPDNTDYNFCTCPSGLYDSNAQPSWVLHVEDRDGDGQDDYDALYAALMLDYEAASTRPFSFVEFREHVDPGAELPPPFLQVPSEQPLGRPDPFLRTLQIGFPGTLVDLCNDAGALEPGYHTLRVIVTDRPWFTNIVEDDDEGRKEAEQDGVPDFAAGASYDSITYTFHCADSSVQDSGCDCVSEDEV